MRIRIATVLGTLSLIFGFSGALASQAATRENPERIPFKSLFTEMPLTFLRAWDSATARDHVPIWVSTAISTGLLLNRDEAILREVQKTGSRWGISNQDETKPYIKIGSLEVFRGPSDIGSFGYFLGDGWIHLGTASAFLATGYFGDTTRAWNTGLQLFEGLTTSTIMSQVLKRAFGREGPAVRSAARGVWRPFPSIAEYYRRRTRYDAFPSGHVMVTTITFNIIRWNYPEQDSWLFPLQIGYTSFLALSMINNGVHWAGDYPLGIALGYFFSRAAFQLGKMDTPDSSGSTYVPEISPTIDADGTLITQLKWKF